MLANEREIRGFKVVDNLETKHHEFWILNWKCADLPIHVTDKDPMKLYDTADFLAGVYHRTLKQVERGEIRSFIQGGVACKLPITG